MSVRSFEYASSLTFRVAMAVSIPAYIQSGVDCRSIHCHVQEEETGALTDDMHAYADCVERGSSAESSSGLLCTRILPFQSELSILGIPCSIYRRQACFYSVPCKSAVQGEEPVISGQFGKGNYR